MRKKGEAKRQEDERRKRLRMREREEIFAHKLVVPTYIMMLQLAYGATLSENEKRRVELKTIFHAPLVLCRLFGFPLSPLARFTINT
jgi:hypothetical protein